MYDLSPPPLLETRALTLHAAGRVLVAGLDWQVEPGQRWCVIGRNAVGKSSLLRAVAGLSVPQRSGEVDWLGRSQRHWPASDAAALRAWMAQQPGDRFTIDVRRLLELSVVRREPGAGDDGGGDQALKVLAELDAAALAGRSVLQLSGGERQRVALAQCRLQGAPLMLLDEPVSFQDPAHQALVARWLVGQTDRALVITAHDVNWIAGVATHVLALYGDGAWDSGPAAQMLQREVLCRAYGCDWRDLGGLWVVAPA
jgi:iron complex transport system ATP-binding protein